MKKLLAALILASPLALFARSPPEAEPLSNVAIRLDGGNALPLGSVTSISLSCVAEMNCSGSPITTNGTLAQVWASQAANKVLASPDNTTGIFSARSIVPRDLGASNATGLCLKGSSATVMDWAACGGGGGMADPGGNGIMARTALNTSINRTIVCADTYCTWANGDGVSGNPSFTLSVTPGHEGGAVALQAATPGTQQTGNLNISGKIVTGGDIAAGANLNATAGTLTAVTMNATGTNIQWSGKTKMSSSADGFWLVQNNANTADASIEGLRYASSAPPTVASAGTIAPVNNVTIISGTTLISTITVPGTFPGGCLHLVPSGLWTTNTAGNISLASTAVVGKTMIMCWDGTKWNPSY
jgi:hypothetical protein